MAGTYRYIKEILIQPCPGSEIGFILNPSFWMSLAHRLSLNLAQDPSSLRHLKKNLYFASSISSITE